MHRERVVERRQPTTFALAVATGLLLLFAFQASVAALRDSVTVDEFVHLPMGLYMLLHRDFHLDVVHGTLSRMIPALPLWVGGTYIAERPDLTHWALAFHFLAEHPDEYPKLFLLPRAVVIVEALLLGALLYRWASVLYGDAAGACALILFAFSPTFLAHGHLVTTDLPATLALVFAAYAGWRFVDDPSTRRAGVLGAVLGVAPALKLTVLPVEAAIFFLIVVTLRRRNATTAANRNRVWIQLFGAVVVAVAVVNLCYGCQGTLSRVADLNLDPQGKIAWLAARFPSLRLPVPAPLLVGLDEPAARAQTPDPESYLAGQWSRQGWWYYHLVAFALKTPLPMVIWALVAVLGWLAGRAAKGTVFVVVPAIAVFATNALFNPIDIGVRHVMAAEAYLIVAASPWIVRGWRGSSVEASSSRGTRQWIRMATALSILWYAAGTLEVAPRYLEYFNEAAGGPSRGHRWLIDSNLDWGQDLVRLADYLNDHHLESVPLAYFGSVNPIVYGVHFQPLDPATAHGITVISASLLMGQSYFAWHGPHELAWSGFGQYDWLRRLEPIDRVGSMFVFDLP